MALPEFTKKKIEKILNQFCESKIPTRVRHQVRLSYAFRGPTVSLIENRVVWNDATKWTHSPVAQFRHDEKKLLWTLFCCDRNQKWHLYQSMKPQRSFEVLISEVNSDPTGIFWG